MFEGNIFRVATGIPILKSALANIPLALAEPEPFTLAKRITKSLYLTVAALLMMQRIPVAARGLRNAAYPTHWSGSAQHKARNANRRLRL